MNKAPFSARRHRVRPRPAQKTEIIGVQQFLNGIGIPIELLLEKVNSARVLVTTKDEFLFALALRFLMNAGQYRQ
jgi:hypothetical protein